MQKYLLKGMVSVFGVLLMSSVVFAQPTVENFPITANIPAASSVSFVVSRVDSSNNFSPNGSTALTFNMEPKPALGIYLPTYTFAIDVATSGGAGNPSVLIEYTDTNNPNDAVGGQGLLAKGVAAAQKVSGPTGSQTVTDLLAATLGNIDGQTITTNQLAGGFMRLLVGIATGNTNPVNGPIDPPNAEPFTNADLPGDYTGTLTLSATLP